MPCRVVFGAVAIPHRTQDTTKPRTFYFKISCRAVLGAVCVARIDLLILYFDHVVSCQSLRTAHETPLYALYMTWDDTTNTTTVENFLFHILSSRHVMHGMYRRCKLY